MHSVQKAQIFRIGVTVENGESGGRGGSYSDTGDDPSRLVVSTPHEMQLASTSRSSNHESEDRSDSTSTVAACTAIARSLPQS